MNIRSSNKLPASPIEGLLSEDIHLSPMLGATRDVMYGVQSTSTDLKYDT